MPEGPEVRTIVGTLNDTIVDRGSKLRDVEIISGRYLKTLPIGMEEFKKAIPDLHFQGVGVKGKFIFWKFTDEWFIFSTLGMAGWYSPELDSYSRVKFTFYHQITPDREYYLYYTDMRNFGTLKFVNSRAELDKKLNELGPDLIRYDFDFDEFLKRARRRKTKNVAQLLMDQKALCGVGNVYKSETLYLAKMNPLKMIVDCTDQELINLVKVAQRVLKNSYMQMDWGFVKETKDPAQALSKKSERYVYQKKQDPAGCPVEQLNAGDGRTTWWVPEKQT